MAVIRVPILSSFRGARVRDLASAGSAQVVNFGPFIPGTVVNKAVVLASSDSAAEIALDARMTSRPSADATELATGIRAMLEPVQIDFPAGLPLRVELEIGIVTTSHMPYLGVSVGVLTGTGLVSVDLLEEAIVSCP